MLIDGHLRAETTPDAVVPVLVLDVDEAEADKILLTHDPLAAMATASQRAPAHAARRSANRKRSRARNARLTGTAVRRMEHRADSCRSRAEVNVPESYQVVVECRDEEDQQAVFERMRARAIAAEC